VIATKGRHVLIALRLHVLTVGPRFALIAVCGAAGSPSVSAVAIIMRCIPVGGNQLRSSNKFVCARLVRFSWNALVSAALPSCGLSFKGDTSSCLSIFGIERLKFANYRMCVTTSTVWRRTVSARQKKLPQYRLSQGTSCTE
jgi:hypothetical protein